jgi:hypothetical protein
MSEARFLNVEHRVANLESESLRVGEAIERLKKEDAVLENDISTLLLLLENFFVWPSSAPRYGDAQNVAFDTIRELLKEMRQRYPLERV